MTPPIRGKTWHPIALKGPVIISQTRLWGLIDRDQRKAFEENCERKYMAMVKAGKVVFG